jgi:glycosyltransferase involved in cell wall biosynthesis
MPSATEVTPLPRRGHRPLFSLVVSTIGRDEALDRLCWSLRRQTLRDFELIVVDQSSDGATRQVLAAHSDALDIRHLVSRPGLSHGRNVGMAEAQGRILAFPDDDCWYQPDTLQRVAAFFEAHRACHILSGSATDEAGAPIGRWDREAGPITTRNVLRRCISITLFARASVAASVGGFDERMGAGSGSPFGSGEETDFLLRAMRAGAQAHFDPSLVIFHPDTRWAEPSGRKAFAYGTGMGLLIAKHRLGLRALLPSLIRPLGGSVLTLLRGQPARAWYYWRSLNGRLWGYRNARRLAPSQAREPERARIKAS